MSAFGKSRFLSRIRSKQLCRCLLCKISLNGIRIRCHRSFLLVFSLDWFYERSKPYLFTSLWSRSSLVWSLLQWRRFPSIWPVWSVLLFPPLDSPCKIFIRKKYPRWTSLVAEWENRSMFLFSSLSKISRFIILYYSLYSLKYPVVYSSLSGSSTMVFRSTPIRNTWVGDDPCEDRTFLSSCPICVLVSSQTSQPDRFLLAHRWSSQFYS